MKALIYLGIISISLLHAAADLLNGGRGGPLSLLMQAQQPHEEAGSKENLDTSNPFAHVKVDGVGVNVVGVNVVGPETIEDPVDQILGVTNRENIGKITNATVPNQVIDELKKQEVMEELRHGVLSDLDPDGAKSDLDNKLFNTNPLDDDLRYAKIASAAA